MPYEGGLLGRKFARMARKNKKREQLNRGYVNKGKGKSRNKNNKKRETRGGFPEKKTTIARCWFAGLLFLTLGRKGSSYKSNRRHTELTRRRLAVQKKELERRGPWEVTHGQKSQEEGLSRSAGVAFELLGKGTC